MALKKCPLCGNMLLNGECKDCGYSVPDETEISSMYNYDPDDDFFGEDNRFSDRADKYTQPEPTGKRDEVIKRGQDIITPEQRIRVPEIKKAENNAMQVNVNPYANISPVENQQHLPQRNRQFNQSVSDPGFVKDLVMAAVLTLIFSVAGIIYGIKFIKQYNKTKDNKYLFAAIAIFILTIIGFII